MCCFPPTPALILILNMHYLEYSCCIPISAWDFHVEGNRKLQWVFVFRSDCPKQWRIFLFSLGDWKGTHVTKHRLVFVWFPISCTALREFWHWRMFPPHSGPLWKWLHNIPTRKLNWKKERKKPTLNSYCSLPPATPWGVSPLPCSVSNSVSSKKRKSDFLICWNIIYVRFEKVVMAWVWVAGQASPGEFSLAGGVFFVVTTYKLRRRHLLSDSVGTVSMFSLNSELNISFEKENIEETYVFHLKFRACCLINWKLTLSPSRKLNLIHTVFYLTLDKDLILKICFKKRCVFLTAACSTNENYGGWLSLNLLL